MSGRVHSMPEALIARPSEAAWGCSNTRVGWVPFPKKTPRRHALIDTVGRTDDPCDRPAYKAPDWKPVPAFEPPREGYPNDVCNLEDYNDVREQEELPEGAVLINVGKDTPKGIQLRIPVTYMDQTNPQAPSVEQCCDESRTLDPTKRKYEELLPQQNLNSVEEFQTESKKCSKSCCNPTNPDYPCTGVIGETLRELVPINLSDKDKCLPLSLRSGEKGGNWRDLKPLTGWEFIKGQKTCDLYPIAEDLPSRFNNPLWFKGYGCEKPSHPFYVTTTQDYGRFSPNPHTMTQRFFPRSGKFTTIMAAGGMYRNRSLNTSNTKSYI